MKWKIAEKVSQDLVKKFPGYSPEILQLFFNRGLDSQEKIDSFLNPKYEDLLDPFLFRDMGKLVERVKQARDKSETVYVYGDYDADGVCSSVLVVETLRRLGCQPVGIYIPHRDKEGYGLNPGAIDFIKSQGASLLITVDCGTSNVEEVKQAKAQGMDVIIIDHHEEPPKLPLGASAFLNPHLAGETYPFKNLAACGVAFKVVQALWQSFDLPKGQEKWFLDLVAIATVADMMDLQEENRNIVKHGLLVLNKTKRWGLQELIKAVQIKLGEIGVYEIGFVIAPRLNAAGRMDHANTAYELMETADANIARELAESLNITNTNRQTETARIVRQAMEEQAQKQFEAGNLVLVVLGKDWPVGVVGLAASRITEYFNRPSLVITQSAKGLTGSGRSIPGFDITRALAASSRFLLKFGGHKGACGLTLKSADVLEDFKDKLNAIARKKLSAPDLIKTAFIDLELGLEKIKWDLVNQIEKFNPFGIGNPRPKFATFAARVTGIFLMGSNNQHMRLQLEQNGASQEAVLFGAASDLSKKLAVGDLIDLAYEVNINEWNGTRRIQLKILDINSG